VASDEAPEPETDASPGRPSLAERVSNLMGTRPDLPSLSVTGLFLLAVGTLLYFARSVFVPLSFALMLYFLLRPAVRALGVAYVPKALGSAIVLGGLLAGLAYAAVQLAEPARSWGARLPQAAQKLEHRFQELRRPVERASQLADKVERATDVGRGENVREVTLNEPTLFDNMLESATEFLAELFVMLFAAYFLLIDGDSLLNRLFRYLPDAPDRERAGSVINEIERRMGQYLRTVTFINLALGAVLGVALQLLGMPNPWLWAGLAAILNYVPYVGPGVGIVIVALASFLTFRDPSAAILPPLVYLGVATIEGNVLTPMILGRAFQISPLVVFVWLVFWGWLWSVPGAIIAVPLLMLIKITSEQSPTLAPLAALMRR
jgi:predicted PurR-regulated permease PerM